MSLLGSLNTSRNGLLSQSYALSNISSNLANANTTAYKASVTNFEDLVSQCSTADSSGTNGAIATTNPQYDVQGAIQATSTQSNLAINGNGYFAVKAPTTSAGGSLTFSDNTYYTRRGDFSLNAQGYLDNSDGYCLMGYGVNGSTGKADPTTFGPVNISSSLTSAANPTTAIAYTANLNASATPGSSSTGSDVTVYDSKGISHDVSYAWKNTGTNTWALTVSSTGGASNTGGDYSNTVNVTFNSSGGLQSIDNTTNGTITGNSISFDLNYDGAKTQTVSCDLSGLSQFAPSSSSSTASVAQVYDFTQNGTAAGSFSSLSFDSSGNVAVNYTNGVSKTYFTIPLATFANSDGLGTASGNAYEATDASGAATPVLVGSDGRTTLATSALESSDVDIATEFTSMIKAQEVYSANSKAISTVNSMMQTLIQLQSA